MRRVVIPELLDSDAGRPDEIAASLRDLRRINRWFGGTATLAALVRRFARETGKRELTLLDVAAGSGYVASTVQNRLKAEGIDLRVRLCDRAATHLCSGGVAGDALALPFRDDAFDLVASTLFLHHLEPAQITIFAREALRCSSAFLINDLIRDPVHVALVYAGLPLFGRITRHDSVASVKRAYTVEEVVEALAGASPSRVEVSRHYLYRMGVIAWR